MLRNFFGGMIVLASILPMGIEIPGLQNPDCYYLLMGAAFLTAAYGTRLILGGVKGEGKGEPSSETISITQKYYIVQQVRRDSFEPQKAK